MSPPDSKGIKGSPGCRQHWTCPWIPHDSGQRRLLWREKGSYATPDDHLGPPVQSLNPLLLLSWNVRGGTATQTCLTQMDQRKHLSQWHRMSQPHTGMQVLPRQLVGEGAWTVWLCEYVHGRAERIGWVFSERLQNGNCPGISTELTLVIRIQQLITPSLSQTLFLILGLVCFVALLSK